MSFSLVACSDEPAQVNQGGVIDKGDEFTVDLSLDISDMKPTMTRALDENPVYEKLKLYVVEFEKKGGPLDGNTLSHVYEPDEETVNPEDGDKHFTLTLKKTEDAKVLHLIAVPNTVDLNIPFGLEGEVIPSLTVSNGNDAYWQRLEFPKGYGVQDGDSWTLNDGVTTQFDHVPMIRNFAKVTVSSKAEDFNFEGFVIVNTPKVATVAPWNSTNMTFPKFLNDKKEMLDADLGYPGYFPFDNVNEVNTSSPKEGEFDYSVKYLYERPSSSINNTYIIIKGNRGGSSMYYKLDIGMNDGNNIFKYHNILRNFWYEINLNSVRSNGYSSIEEAMRGVVYNNFSFDVNTRQMINISDGTKMIWVNKTTFVVNDVDSTTVNFQYRFDDDITKPGYNTGKLEFIDQATGEIISHENISRLSDGVITSWGSPSNIGTEGEGWKQTQLKTIDPTGNRKSYTFIAYDPESGIGRTIEVIVRQPWEYKDLGVWGGNYNTRKQFINEDYPKKTWEGFVSTDSPGQPLTVVFTIDNDLPESIFPLTFTLEAEQQNIENNKIGTLVVSSGDSFFEGQKSSRIKYVKTVSWTEYNTELTLKNITGTKVTHDDGTVLHRVRCRFLTIMAIEDNIERRIRIHNDYIKQIEEDGSYSTYGEVSFKGKSGIAPNWGLDSEDKPLNADQVTK